MKSAPALSYVVCTAPRTGSTLLCGALSRTGIAGRPDEYFDIHAHNEAHWRRHLAIDQLSEYVSKVLMAGTTANGVFGLKLHWHQAPSLRAKMLADPDCPAPPEIPPGQTDDSLHDLLTGRLGEVRYVWLRRRNSLAQAISYYRASLTDVWRVPAGATAAAKHVAFDYVKIARHLELVQSFDRAWYAYFMARKLPALTVVYEDFCQSYDTTIRGVLRFLGQDAAGATVPGPSLQRQADADSSAWERRFLDIKAHGPEPAYTPSRKTRPSSRRNAAKAEAVPLPMVAYDLASTINLAIEPASPNRAWMDAMPKRFAYRCLPLVMANQAGWMIQNSHGFSAEWDGAEGTGAVRVTYDEEGVKPYAESHFGSGILTFSVGYLFRTPPGWNLHVRGPANWPKDGICALDAIVETDWTYSTFTMNWQITRPHHKIRFEPGEPVAMISPVRRGDVERFRPQVQPLAADPVWHKGYTEWSTLRTTFNVALKQQRPDAVQAGWQRHYLLGLNPGDVPAPEHQTGLSLSPFVDRRIPR